MLPHCIGDLIITKLLNGDVSIFERQIRIIHTHKTETSKIIVVSTQSTTQIELKLDLK